MLEDFKCDLGIFENSKDRQLQRLLDKATNDIVNFTHQKEEYVLNKLRESIIDIATVRYNQKGAEGLSNRAYSGESEGYLSDIPDNIKRVLMAHRRLS